MILGSPDLLDMMVHTTGSYILTVAKGPAPNEKLTSCPFNSWGSQFFRFEKHCHSGCATALSSSCVSSQLVAVQPLFFVLRMNVSRLLFSSSSSFCSRSWHPKVEWNIPCWPGLGFSAQVCETVCVVQQSGKWYSTLKELLVVPLQLLGPILQQNCWLPSLFAKTSFKQPSFSCRFTWMFHVKTLGFWMLIISQHGKVISCRQSGRVFKCPVTSSSCLPPAGPMAKTVVVPGSTCPHWIKRCGENTGH